MNFPYGLLPQAWHWIAVALYVLILLPTFLRAPWRSLADNERLHVYLGTCVGLLLLWSIRSTVIPGLEYHYLGATLLTLMFGWRLAVVGISVVLAVTIINDASDWQTYPMNALIMGITPVLVSHGIYRLVDRRLPNNFFIYVFLPGYFGAAIAVLTANILASCLLLLSGAYSLERLSEQYLPLAPLLAVPEAFITGALVSVMAAFRPTWVSTFDDNRYLKGK